MKKYISLLLLLAWIALVLFLSYQTGKDTATTSLDFTSNVLKFFMHHEPTYEELLLWDGRFRLWAHFVLMFLYSIICFETVWQWIGSLKKSIVLTGLSGVVLGVMSEVGKLRIEGRHCDISEMGLNILGVIVGTVIMFVAHELIAKRADRYLAG
ncbi:MAG: VanZ family protein [Lachnospiraceae bacterium]|nr:VanZ family protein [Lachnospiraceae bacterium]